MRGETRIPRDMCAGNTILVVTMTPGLARNIIYFGLVCLNNNEGTKNFQVENVSPPRARDL